MNTICPKCGKKLNPQKSFSIYLGSDGRYYDYKVSYAANGKRIHEILNAPVDITLKFVNVGYDCRTAIGADIKNRDNGNQRITRKLYAPSI